MNAVSTVEGFQVGKSGKKIIASMTMRGVLNARQQQALDQQRMQDAERAEIKASRPAVKRAVALAQEQGGEVEYVDRGPVRIITRDGLLWLIAKKRLQPALRDAAERYRADFTVVHGGQIKSCIDDSIGGGGGDGSMTALVAARARLQTAREVALIRDGRFIWIMDEVAGKGSTIRSLALNDDYQATCLEVEFKVACRLLARHYGLST